MRTWGEDSQVQAKERGLRRSNVLTPGFQASSLQTCETCDALPGQPKHTDTRDSKGLGLWQKKQECMWEETTFCLE